MFLTLRITGVTADGVSRLERVFAEAKRARSPIKWYTSKMFDERMEMPPTTPRFRESTRNQDYATYTVKFELPIFLMAESGGEFNSIFSVHEGSRGRCRTVNSRRSLIEILDALGIFKEYDFEIAENEQPDNLCVAFPRP